MIKALNGIRNDLRIFISILEPYYFCFIEETKCVISKDEWIFKRIETKDNEIKSILRKINEFFSINGYTELSYDDVTISVPNVETELKELNKANVFDCLFTDLFMFI